MSSAEWKSNNTEKIRKSKREHYARNSEHYKEMTKAYREAHRTKVCATCNIEKSAEEYFTKVVNGRRYLRYECKGCHRDRFKDTPARKVSDKRRKERANGLLKIDRQNPEFRSKFLLMDIKSSDKKKGLKCELTKQDVSDLITSACAYCHREDIKMTLDRIDNGKGHTFDNVVACCCLCNYFRRDMPYDAWIMIAPAFKSAILAGALAGWRPGPFKNFKWE